MVGLAFLLLMVVFRSVLVPLKAALGFLLSVLAALGAVVAVFQWGWLSGLMGVEQTGPIMSMMEWAQRAIALRSFDNTEVAFCARAECLKSLFVSLAFVGGQRSFVTVKFDNDRSLLQA